MNKEKFEALAKELHFLHLDNSEEASNKRGGTGYPIFYVQEKHLIGVVGEEAHDYSLDGPYGDGELKVEYVDPDSCEAYDSLDDLRESCDDWESFKDGAKKINEVSCLYIYIDVCAHLTQEAAQLYIDQNRHNLRAPRVFIKSMYRCHELIGLVEAIATGKIDWVKD